MIKFISFPMLIITVLLVAIGAAVSDLIISILAIPLAIVQTVKESYK